MAVVYNERSWAIDLISYVGFFLSERQLKVKKAGGEHSIHDSEGTLFPDVLLFGDQTGQSILQGWELKMPDTPVTDTDLIENASEKAKRLGLNSFVIWNVNQAVLYISQPEIEEYAPERSWSIRGEPISERAAVPEREDDWKNLADRILKDVDQLLRRGTIRERDLVEAFNNDDLIESFFDSVALTVENMKDVSRKDSTFKAQVEEWWSQVGKEYQSNKKLVVLANRSLAGWITKIIFTHALKRVSSVASEIEQLDDSSSTEDAFQIFDDVTQASNFLNLYHRELGENQIAGGTWKTLLQVNSFFSDLELGSIGPEATQALLHSTVSAAKRKTAGQFTTPQKLARLLVRVSVENQEGTVYDPFCGTGTIVAASYDEKRAAGLTAKQALSGVWASDKFAFPLKATTLTLSRPEHMGEVQNVFQSDALDLDIGQKIDFRHPDKGELVSKELPAADFIVSNLPFVQFEDVADSNTATKQINQRILALADEEIDLPGRSDLYAYLPFHLWTLLNDGGVAGLIMSNAWLGTNWGRDFRKTLRRFFEIEKVIVSGKGRWFQNADVVTTLIVLRKRSDVGKVDRDEKTSYITVQKDLSELKDKDQKLLSSRLILDREATGWTKVQKYSVKEIESYESLGIEWTGLFSELEWLDKMSSLVRPASDIFDIGRGKRRGWNKLFYPKEGHGIESEYIERGLKKPSSAKGLVAETDIEVFVCSRSIDELMERGDEGALSWIRKFQHQTSGSNVPLPEKLARSGIQWYEMRTDALADIVMPVNPYQRLFIPKLPEPTFVDQRFTCFTLKDTQVDADLCHALMNSLPGLFFMEAMGFGRGLGALDLSTTRVRRNLHMIDPHLLSGKDKKDIMDKFSPLLDRSVESLPSELSKSDRETFDKAVLRSIGLSGTYDDIRASLLHLYEVRMAVE